MEVTVKLLSSVKFSIHSRTHSILCDQPPENGGSDSGMTPPELMLASLGGCAEFYAVQYLKARNLEQAELEVTVTAEKLKSPARLGNFHIHVSCPTPLTAEQTEGLSRAVHHCLIHNTLMSPPQIAIELAVGEPALP